MNDDRELLELAARAAGLVDIDNETFEMWNPLADPGDALRLAVALNMSIEVYADGCVVSFVDNTIRCDECNSTNPLAATMRAITRAAAEIGRAR